MLTPEAMGRADQRTIAAGTPVTVLMERAGRAVAWEVRRTLGACYGRRAVVVCGKGNNGGDGLVTATALERWGMRVHVVELAVGCRSAPGSRARSAMPTSRSTRCTAPASAARSKATRHGSPSELRTWGGPVVAVDIPSGVDGLTGAVHGTAVHASSTVTFAARKPGLVFEPGKSHAGKVRVVDIGIDLGLDGADPPPIACYEARRRARELLPPRPPAAHKWMAGVMVVGGSGGMTGAPMFVSHAAMRAGAGIVWCGLPGRRRGRASRRARRSSRGRSPPPTTARSRRSQPSAVLADISRFRALALGPGPRHRTRRWCQAVVALVAEARVPLVLDADGLNALNGDLEPLRTRQTLGVPTVLTPHDGEYALIAGQPVGDDRMAAAQRLADRSGAVVLLKGPGTVIAEPATGGRPGRVALNDTGSAALATAGSGDVLTGVIAGFLARGVPGLRSRGLRCMGPRARGGPGGRVDGRDRRRRD